MQRNPKLTFAVLLLLLAVVLFAWVLTEPGSWLFQGKGQNASLAKNAQLDGIPEEFTVDKQPLVKARELAAWAGTPEEQDLAAEVEKIADHEVDLDFASALRRVNAHPPTPSKEARELEARVQQMEGQIKKDQDRALDLQQKAQHASGADQEALQGQSELADAQLALDEDEIADAKGDLERAGGDVQTKVVHSREQHEAAESARGKTVYGGALGKESSSPNSLRAHIQQWYRMRAAQSEIMVGQQQASNAVANLTRQHKSLEEKVRQGESRKQAVTQQDSSVGTDSSTANGSSVASVSSGASVSSAATASKEASAAALASVQQLSEAQRGMSELDKRIQDHQELTGIYGRWIDAVKLRQWAALHAILASLLWIVVIALLVYILSRVIEKTLSDSTISDRKHLLTLRTVIRFSLKTAGLLAIIFVIFGVPDQMPTVLGLAGAGLTVALQDFIVGFCGWFVLMGRNGIRVGDFVEINGVGGEVVEIGLLRTVLLETGSSTGSGYPTGRQVAFINSYAIKGHYFNFSTSGQWLWDELVVQVPAGEDSTPVVDSILKIVSDDTEKNARMAEQEWQRVTQHYGVKAFSAAPSISVRPSGVSVEVVVRYITRAQERYEVRTRLYQAIVELFQGKRSATVAVSVPQLPGSAVRN